MFAIVSGAFHQVLSGIGTILISLGMSLSNSAMPAPEAEINADIEIAAEVTGDSYEQSSSSTSEIQGSEADNSKKTAATHNSVSITSSKVTENTVTPKVAVNDTSEVDFKIKNISLDTNKEGDAVTITWTTSASARSRVEFDERIYESENGVSTDHTVSISGLTKSKRYEYTITARTQGEKQLEDDVNGSYVPIANFKTYAVTRGSKTEECQEFIVLDENGKAGVNVEIQVSTDYENYSSAYTKIKSNSNGVAKYCEAGVKHSDAVYKINSEQTGLIKI